MRKMRDMPLRLSSRRNRWNTSRVEQYTSIACGSAPCWQLRCYRSHAFTMYLKQPGVVLELIKLSAAVVGAGLGGYAYGYRKGGEQNED